MLFSRLARKLRLERFWRGEGSELGPVRLTPRKIYVLPTREGLAFAFVLFAVLMGAINYQASLGFALVFLLAGMGLVAMVLAQRNLARLTIVAQEGPPVFAGGRVRYPVRVDNPDGPVRYSLILRTPEGFRTVADIPVGSATVFVEAPAHRRGVQPLGSVTFESYQPLHIFRSWSPVKFGAAALVYPSPGPRRPLPLTAGEEEGGDFRSGGAGGVEDFAGLREYAPGDPVSRMHWKATARSGALTLKEFEREAMSRVALEYSKLAGMDPEARLEQLCRWVVDAERQAIAFSLELPGGAVEYGRGPAHRRRCLDALARFEP